jgi:hypothetical protein
MEPLLYQLEWDVAIEVLFTIVLLSFFVERALSLVFEHRLYDATFGGTGVTEVIAMVVSVLVVRYCGFDALAVVMRRESNDWFGYIITGAIVAGGSKASIKLFHDLLNVRSGYMKRKAALMDEGVGREEAIAIAAGKKPAARSAASVGATEEK